MYCSQATFLNTQTQTEVVQCLEALDLKKTCPRCGHTVGDYSTTAYRSLRGLQFEPFSPFSLKIVNIDIMSSATSGNKRLAALREL
jgi:hypothetical protein